MRDDKDSSGISIFMLLFSCYKIPLELFFFSYNGLYAKVFLYK